MTNYKNLAAFHTPIIPREAESIDDKIEDSKALLAEFAGQSLMDEITSEEFVTGEVPRLSEFDLRFLPPKSRFVKLPKQPRSYGLEHAILLFKQIRGGEGAF
jgi:hypothetical protein